jgi:hypothetical protein
MIFMQSILALLVLRMLHLACGLARKAQLILAADYSQARTVRQEFILRISGESDFRKPHAPIDAPPNALWHARHWPQPALL